jgi:hypothetical protein
MVILSPLEADGSTACAETPPVYEIATQSNHATGRRTFDSPL